MSLRPDHPGPPTDARIRLRVAGTVQGVGFRPFVYRLAAEIGLAGWVRNTAAGAEIEVQGAAGDLERFEMLLGAAAPPLCSIRDIDRCPMDVRREDAFRILESAAGETPVPSIPADVATCADCVREIFNPSDRRFRYPFTNCTNCGPRLSIIQGLPYDRPTTTMAGFPMCAHCRDEYEDPMDRRFHAQPIACPECGPHLELRDPTGRVLAERDAALAGAVDAIRAGRIIAAKGLGGYHLILDARNQEAATELRARKHRPTKPFALMDASVESVEAYCEVSSQERVALCSPRAPIVLLRRRPSDRLIADAVAPRNPYLGVMLPTTPLHHLMLRDLGFPIVATSGNLSDEPICFTDDDAATRLASLADLLLTHDRPIARPVDDSIVQVFAGAERVLRRSRGFAPESLTLPIDEHARPIAAVGGQQKATVCVNLGNRAVLSQHVGDLDTPASREALERALSDLQRMLGVRPERVARDAHPDYASTHLAEATGLPATLVQHHAAHVFAAMAEHGVGPDQTVLGASWDGTGFGDDGTVWGGELLKIRGASVERAGHLRPFALPGGDAAMRRPYRSALGVLHEIMGPRVFEEHDLAPMIACPASERTPLRAMLARGFNAPRTTSAGRLFDATASVLDLRQTCTFEGEGAMLLQFAAESVNETDHLAPAMPLTGAPLVLDWAPLMSWLIERRRKGVPVADCARAFHEALATGLADMICEAAGADEPVVMLTGGCFQNALLAELCVERLASRGMQPLLHERVPPNDGGLALGQLYATALMADGAGMEDR